MRFNAFDDASHSEYDTILERVRNAPILHVDETSMPSAILRIQSPGKEAPDLGIHHTSRDFCRDPEESGHKSSDRGSDEAIQGNDRM